MVFVAIRFEGVPLEIEDWADAIMLNAEKPVPKILFDVKTYILDENILAVRKEFVALHTMNYIFGFMFVVSLIPLWFGFVTPLIIISFLIMLWFFLNSTEFNFWMFKLMIRRAGYSGKMELV